MNNKKVCILITSLYGGGAERVTVDLANHLSKDNPSSIVTLKGSDDDLYKCNSNVKRHSLEISRPIGLLAVVSKFREYVKTEKPDVVIGMMTYNSIIALLATIGLSTKVIATERNNILMNSTPLHWKFLRWLLYRRSECVIVQTKIAAELVKSYVNSGKIKVIPNAVNWPLREYKPTVPIEDFSTKDEKLLLAVGRLTYQKGFDLLIEAFSDCGPKNWKLLIVGGGDSKTQLNTIIETRGLKGKVTLVGRVGNISEWYARADLFVLSSRYEGFPNVLLEAMASGCACLSTRCQTGPEEIIDHGRNGFLTNIEDLRESLSHLMEDYQLRSSLASKAIEVRDKYESEKIVRLWAEVIM